MCDQAVNLLDINEISFSLPHVWGKDMRNLAWVQPPLMVIMLYALTHYTLYMNNHLAFGIILLYLDFFFLFHHFDIISEHIPV